MMEFSVEMPDDALTTLLKQKSDTYSPLSTSCQLSEDIDIIETSKLNFGDNESWLFASSNRSDSNLQEWLCLNLSDASPVAAKPSPKNIDTRTFTRPKKRFTRPSIEKYNEELYGNDLKELTDSGIQINGCSQEDPPSSSKPLHFDLSQTISSSYFENILSNAPMIDSFQNMSPPSLVNSMCSSTFANLMESSFIKNDPVLREIRDTDYTGSILQQESEPMFQSITESYSSLNSDVPENFLKKVSFTEKSEDVDVTVVNNVTFEKDDPCDETVILSYRNEDFQNAKATIQPNLNSTYQRKPKSTTTIQPEAPLMNSTFQRRKNSRYATKIITSQELGPDLNATITIEPLEKPIENTKRLLDRRPSPSLDLNRLSYLVDKNDQQQLLLNDSSKRNSFGSTDSGENLDYMSLSSGSGKSSKRQSTDGINMIVDMPETKISMATFRKSPRFQQIMSTPKPANRSTNLWPNHEISPIRDRNSDPEISSNEHSREPLNAIKKQKSVSNIHQKAPPLSRAGEMKIGVAIRGSHPNLRMAEPRTYGLQRPSNLNSMGHTLKGSYTSLRPTNANLPVAPPPLDVTVVRPPPPAAQVAPIPREVPRSQDSKLVQPRPVRSGLPRPVSRIPGPRSLRPVSKSAGQQGRY